MTTRQAPGTAASEKRLPAGNAAIVHGTYRGWNKHKRRGEQPCGPCKQACAEYKRKWRASNEQARAGDRWRGRTRSAALERLAREYPQRFTELLAEERQP